MENDPFQIQHDEDGELDIYQQQINEFIREKAIEFRGNIFFKYIPEDHLEYLQECRIIMEKLTGEKYIETDFLEYEDEREEKEDKDETQKNETEIEMVDHPDSSLLSQRRLLEDEYGLVHRLRAYSPRLKIRIEFADSFVYVLPESLAPQIQDVQLFLSLNKFLQAQEEMMVQRNGISTIYIPSERPDDLKTYLEDHLHNLTLTRWFLGTSSSSSKSIK